MSHKDNDPQRDLAMSRANKALQAGAQKCKSEEDLRLYAESIACLALFFVRGLNSDEYVQDFLDSAKADKTSIKAERVM